MRKYWSHAMPTTWVIHFNKLR